MGSKLSSLVKRRTTLFLKNNPEIIAETVSETIENFRKHGISLREYNLNLKEHHMFHNRTSAAFSDGCGCNYCVERHLYVRAKLDAARLERSINRRISDYSWFDTRAGIDGKYGEYSYDDVDRLRNIAAEHRKKARKIKKELEIKGILL